MRDSVNCRVDEVRYFVKIVDKVRVDQVRVDQVRADHIEHIEHRLKVYAQCAPRLNKAVSLRKNAFRYFFL